MSGNNILSADNRLQLKLYVAGMTAKSMQAIKNIRRLCDENLDGDFELEIIDLYKHPEAAKEQQIIFSPSLIKTRPLPRKIVIGTFDDSEKVIRALGLKNNN